MTKTDTRHRLHREAQSEVSGTQSRDSALFHESPTALLLLTRAGLVADANEAAARTLGTSKARLLGRPFLSWVLPDERERSQGAFQEVLAGRVRTWTTRLTRGDGAPRRLTMRAVLSAGPDGSEQILVFVYYGTGSRLSRSGSHQLSALFESLPGHFTTITDRTGRIRDASGIAQTHFRPDADVLGSDYRDILASDEATRQSADEMLERLLAGEDWSGIHLHTRAGGSSFAVETVATPHVDPQTGTILGGLICGLDVSARENLRSRAEKAERLANIGKLVASIARELDEGLEGLVALGGQAATKAEALHRFVGGLGLFAEGRQARKATMDLAEVAGTSVAALREELADSGVSIELEAAISLPPVYADPEHVRNIVTLLVRNAVEAMAGLSAPVVRVAVRQTADGAIISVMDGGPGIAPEWLERIFEPFFTTRTGQAGLGLALVRALVQAQGGRVWADNSPDGGATMTVRLPLVASEPEAPFRAVPLTLTRSHSVLLVEDDESVRLPIRGFLEKVGYEVSEAWSGRSAMARITDVRPPEILITDLKMLDGSGYWLLDQLEEYYPSLLRRTVIVTGDTRREKALKVSLRTGCPLLAKPFDLPVLLEVLEGLPPVDHSGR